MAGEDTPLVAARRARLRAWITDRFGGSRKSFLEDVAARGIFLDPTEVSNLQSGGKSFGEKKAEQIEVAAGMPKDYLVRPLSVSPASPVVEAPLPDLLLRAHRILAARGPYSLDDAQGAQAFSQAYVEAAVEHLNAFQRMELDRATGPAMQEELRKQSEQHPSQKPAPTVKSAKVSTRKG